jgi:hypothetical protein
VNRNRPRSPTGIALGRSAIDSSTPAEINEPTLSGRAWAPVALSFASPHHLPGFSAELPDLDAFTAGFW